VLAAAAVTCDQQLPDCWITVGGCPFADLF